MLPQDPKLIPMRQELFLSALILDSGRVGRDCMLGSRISSQVVQGRLLIRSHAARAFSMQHAQVQSKVLPKYGFQGSLKGVFDMLVRLS